MECFVPVLLRKRSSELNVDTIACKIYYKMTFSFFVVSFILSMSKQVFGDAIVCISPGLGDHDRFANQYCWSNSTFIVDGDAYLNSAFKTREYQSYYQWVNLLFLFQALSFYCPHIAWKYNVEWKLRAVSVDSKILKQEECTAVLNALENEKTIGSYYYFYYTCIELLNWIAAVLHFIFMSTFLGKDFSRYGISVAQWTDRWNSGRDPMNRYFPLVTKCTVYIYGSSGDLINKDILCLLPQNVLYARIFLVAWWWFIFLMTFSSLCFLYRISILLSEKLREFISKEYADNVHLWWLFLIAKMNISQPNLNYITKSILGREFEMEFSNESLK